MLSDYRIWLVAGVAAAVVLGAVLVLRWRRRRSDIAGALQSIAIERLRDVLVPDGMGGHIQIEHLVLTGRGIFVIDVKRVEGVVFGSDRMNEWTVIGKRGRFTFPNPLSRLYDRVAAIRQLLRDADVGGFVLFPDAADFSKGRPKDVLLAHELAEQYERPQRNAADDGLGDLAMYWQRIREVAQPAPMRR